MLDLLGQAANIKIAANLESKNSKQDDNRFDLLASLLHQKQRELLKQKRQRAKLLDSCKSSQKDAFDAIFASPLASPVGSLSVK